MGQVGSASRTGGGASRILIFVGYQLPPYLETKDFHPHVVFFSEPDNDISAEDSPSSIAREKSSSQIKKLATDGLELKKN